MVPPSVATLLPRRSARDPNRGGVAVADAQHFAEFVVGQRDRHRRPPGRRVLDPAQADVGVVARDALVDRIEADVDELGPPVEASGEKVRDFDVEPDELIGPGRIGFDKRCAAFRISCPAKHLRRLGRPHGQRTCAENRHKRSDVSSTHSG